MKKVTIILIALLLTMTGANALADNTHSIDLESSNSEYLYISDSAQTGLDINSDMTIEFWIKLEQLPSQAEKPFKIIDKDSGNIGNRSYTLQIHNSYPTLNSLNLNYFDTAGNNITYTVEEIVNTGDVGNWVHIAISVDLSNSIVCVYKNNTNKIVSNSGYNNGSIKNSTASFILGARYGGSSHYFDGKIDNLIIWNYIRTQQQILSDMYNEIDLNTIGLIAYWKFNNNLLDETSNNNDLINHGTSFSSDIPFQSSSPDPEPDSCSLIGTPASFGIAEGLEGNGTFQNIILGVDSTGSPAVCISEIGGNFINQYNFTGFDTSWTPASIAHIPETIYISAICYNTDGEYQEKILNTVTGQVTETNDL